MWICFVVFALPISCDSFAILYLFFHFIYLFILTTDHMYSRPEYNAVRGLETVGLACAVLLLLFLIVYRIGYNRWDRIGQLNVASFLLCVLACETCRFFSKANRNYRLKSLTLSILSEHNSSTKDWVLSASLTPHFVCNYQLLPFNNSHNL